MGDVEAETRQRPEQTAHANMVFIPGGTFRMGSDKHYAEEAPAHRVSVDGFWIDRTPVTNRSLRWHGRNRPLSDTLPAIR